MRRMRLQFRVILYLERMATVCTLKPPNAMYMHILSSITPGIVALGSLKAKGHVLARVPAAVPRAVEHGARPVRHHHHHHHHRTIQVEYLPPSQLKN